MTHAPFPFFKKSAHAQIIQWQPWSQESFALAKRENKQIFLHIGYPSCFFCQTMEKETLQNSKVIQILNQDFVAIQLDRNVFPEVDQFYMTFVQQNFGQAGWPLSVILDADGQPRVGGVNFARRELIRLLHAVRTAKTPQHSQSHNNEVLKTLNASELLSNFDDVLEKNFDFFYGGIGNFPKFPPAPHLRLLLYRLKQKTGPNADQHLRMLNTTLLGMIRGGFFDHIDGGFFRYSLDAKWQVPSFEKTLYDQALLAEIYAEAFSLTHNKVYAVVAKSTLDFVLRHMTAPSGGFYAALNSQSNGSEGDYYLFAPENIQPYQSIFSFFHPTHFENQRGLLFIKETDLMLDPHYEAFCQSLKAQRQHHAFPKRDENILTAWNGLMLGTLARTSSLLSEPSLLAAATKNAHYLQQNLYRDSTLQRGQLSNPLEIAGSLEDYAFLIHGLLNLYEATHGKNWLDWAMHLQQAQDEIFWDQHEGGYFLTAATDHLLPQRPKIFVDEVKPSANGVSAVNLIRLFKISKKPIYLKQAKSLLQAANTTMTRMPLATPNCMLATAMAQASGPR